MTYLALLAVLVTFVTVVDLLAAKYLLQPARVRVTRDKERRP
jgi:hypothetical protein